MNLNTSVQNCALLGHYAVSIGYILPTFRDNLWVQSFWTLDPRRWDR